MAVVMPQVTQERRMTSEPPRYSSATLRSRAAQSLRAHALTPPLVSSSPTPACMLATNTESGYSGRLITKELTAPEVNEEAVGERPCWSRASLTGFFKPK